MSIPLANLQTTSRVIKRAQYEAFEFTIEANGVRVRNASHAKPEEHEYVVTITNGLPSKCECPADAKYDGACKHRVAVAIRKPILDAAIDRQIVADGGEPVSTALTIGQSTFAHVVSASTTSLTVNRRRSSLSSAAASMDGLKPLREKSAYFSIRSLPSGGDHRSSST